eukprot:SAG31_NODE_23015_length_513_cov_0.978261_1_plen_53_part_01
MPPVLATHTGQENVNGGLSVATVAIAGLHSPLRVMHISDSHTDLGPDPASGSE